MTATSQKAKGPASVGALPDHSSTNPLQGMEMNKHSNTTAAAGAASDGSLAAIEALIAEQVVRHAEDDKLWERSGEILERIEGDLPAVKVKTSVTKVYENGVQIDKPLFAYWPKMVDEHIDPHYEAHLAMRGRREDLCAPVHEHFKARKDKLKAELAALEAERKRIETEAGYTDAIAAAKASSEAMREFEAKIISFRPSTLAAAARQAQWVLAALREEFGCYVEDDDLIKTLAAIAEAQA